MDRLLDFSLFTTTTPSAAKFWLPWVNHVAREGVLLVDLESLAARCDPCTQELFGRLFDWEDADAILADVAQLRERMLPCWRGHIELAGLLGKTLAEGATVEDFLFAACAANPELESSLLRARFQAWQLEWEEAQERYQAYMASISKRMSTWLERHKDGLPGGAAKEPDIPDVAKPKLPSFTPYAPLIDQVLAAAVLLNQVKANGLLMLDDLADEEPDSALPFLSQCLTFQREELEETLSLLSTWQKQRLAQFDDNFTLIGWMFLSLRRHLTKADFWLRCSALAGEVLNDGRRVTPVGLNDGSSEGKEA